MAALEKAQHCSIQVVRQLLELIGLEVNLGIVVDNFTCDIAKHNGRQQHALGPELIQPMAIQGALFNQHTIEILPALLQRIKEGFWLQGDGFKTEGTHFAQPLAAGLQQQLITNQGTDNQFRHRHGSALG